MAAAGGSWAVSRANATARPPPKTKNRNHRYEPRLGTAFVHTVIDDHSRVASAEICSDEKPETAIGVLRRAVSWSADRGVTIERVPSDNGSVYKSHAWRDACVGLGVTGKKTRPYRPQTNGHMGGGGIHSPFTALRRPTPRLNERAHPRVCHNWVSDPWRIMFDDLGEGGSIKQITRGDINTIVVFAHAGAIPAR